MQPSLWRRVFPDNITSNQTAPSATSSSLPTGTVICEGAHGIRLRFIGGADGQAFTVAINAIDVDDPHNPQLYMAAPLLAATSVTASTVTGFVGSKLVSNNEYMADTIADPAANISAYAGEVFSYAVDGGLDEYNASGVTANTIAEMLINGIGTFYGLCFTLAALSSEAGNVLYKLDYNIRGA